MVVVGAVGEEGEAAVAGVLEEHVGVGGKAGGELVGPAMPGGGREAGARVLVAASGGEVGGVLDGRGDGGTRGGGFARRVGEGRRRRVGIQLHGGAGEAAGGRRAQDGCRCRRRRAVAGGR